MKTNITQTLIAANISLGIFAWPLMGSASVPKPPTELNPIESTTGTLIARGECVEAILNIDVSSSDFSIIITHATGTQYVVESQYGEWYYAQSKSDGLSGWIHINSTKPCGG